ncbi:MAG TPA: hypothetical protein PKM88_05595 [bacterium]|nr:hypothetical protein [bacterium]
MTAPALRLADALYAVYRGYADDIRLPAPPGVAAASQIVRKTVNLLAVAADTMLRELATAEKRRNP